MMLNCVLLIVFYGLALSKLYFPQIPFFSFFSPFIPHVNSETPISIQFIYPNLDQIFPEDNPGHTIHSNYRQVVLSSTLDFLLVFTVDGLPELRSSFKEIFLVTPFEKNPKLIVFHQILHSEFTELIENIFE